MSHLSYLQIADSCTPGSPLGHLAPAHNRYRRLLRTPGYQRSFSCLKNLEVPQKAREQLRENGSVQRVCMCMSTYLPSCSDLVLEPQIDMLES